MSCAVFRRLSYLRNLCNLRNHLRPSISLTFTTRPWIAAHVIAALFPISGFILCQKAHALDPLGGFPGVQLGNDQTNRAAVLWRNRRAIMHKGKERVLFQEVLEWHVR